ncbi:MAG TPA: LPS export ABC transporter permease LptF [Pseudomonadales bacterium]|nr:LPS export ABC transporter permease LptF [Pseudomonadales bacterium]
MIAARYLRREILLATVAIVLVLLLVTVGARLSGYLGDAAAGRLTATAVVAIIVLRLPEFLSLLLPMGFFLGLLLALARLHAVSELTALRAAGLGEPWLLTRALQAGSLVALLVGLLTLLIVPMANQKLEQVFRDARGLAMVGALVPGRFQRLDGAVVRVDEVDARTGALLGVLLVEAMAVAGDDEAQRLVTASSGRLVTDPAGARMLTLEDGHRYEIAADGALTTVRFRHLSRILETAAGPAPPPAGAARGSVGLWGDADAAARAELHWRLVLPALVLVFATLGVALAHREAGPAGWRPAARALLALLLLVGVVVAGRGAVADGRIAPWLGLWAVPLVVALVACARLLVRRTRRSAT